MSKVSAIRISEQATRLSRRGVAVVFFLLVTLYSPLTSQSIPTDVADPPTLEEVETLAELSEWVLGGSTNPRFRVFTDLNLAAAIHTHSRGFELFRSAYREGDEQRTVLETLPYGWLIADIAERYGVDPFLVAAIVEAESSFDSNALSEDGAVGLMQVLPETAAMFTEGDPADPAVNVDAGTRYLRSLLRRFDGDLALALAGYNAGPGNVARFGGMPPFLETRSYVDRVLALYVDHHWAVWQESPSSGWLF